MISFRMHRIYIPLSMGLHTCSNDLVTLLCYIICHAAVGLKGESVSVVGCGKSHTLIGTSSGQLFAFGSNSDHQCAVDLDGSVETPTEVLLDEPIVFKQLSGGSSHSAGLDCKYVCVICRA